MSKRSKKTIASQEREIVLSVREYFIMENFIITLGEEEITSNSSDDDGPTQGEVEGEEDLGVAPLKW